MPLENGKKSVSTSTGQTSKTGVTEGDDKLVSNSNKKMQSESATKDSGKEEKQEKEINTENMDTESTEDFQTCKEKKVFECTLNAIAFIFCMLE